jgi:hypothetical protein
MNIDNILTCIMPPEILTKYYVGKKGTLFSKDENKRKKYIITKIEECEVSFKILKETLKKTKKPEKIKRPKGWKMTDEQKKKISEANIGRKLSKETCKKMSEYHKGKKRSEESKIKQSISQKKVWAMKKI